MDIQMDNNNSANTNSTNIQSNSDRINRAKPWQLLLFAFNNGATNVYYVIIMNYIAYYANGVLGLALMFATSMVTAMRVFDAFTDPPIGTLIDRTSTKFGKFRPFMLIGNITMIISAILMFFGTRAIPESAIWLRYGAFVLVYALYVIGYTCQTSCTRSGQTVLTNDPNQRPLFNIFNTVASLVGMGTTQVLAIVIGGKYGYGSTQFFNIVIPIGILLSLILTILAIIGIREKDVPKYFGVTGGSSETSKVTLRDSVGILKSNKELQRLIVAGAGTKLGFSIATNASVACMLYASMMGDYGGLYLPVTALGYAASAPFFIANARTSQKKGQRASLIKYTRIAFIFYIGVLVLLLMWDQGNPNTMLSFKNINLYTILFLLFFSIGYGSYYSTADMVIPMTADVADYETYRTGDFSPGIIGTMFSLVDKLVSSFSSTIVGLAVTLIGLKTLPDSNTPYIQGMKGAVIALFVILPMLAWIATLWSMKNYSLTYENMEDIQKVNYARKIAIQNGMNKTDAMSKYQRVDQIDFDVREEAENQ